MSSVPKLYYFDFHGRAEPLRAMFSISGRDYEDIRVSVEDWMAMKGQTPFGQLPMLEIDGKRFAQTPALASYLATELGLAGKNSIENLQISEIVQLWAELGVLYDIALHKREGEMIKERVEAKIKAAGRQFSTEEINKHKMEAFVAVGEEFLSYAGNPKQDEYLDKELIQEFREVTIPKHFGYFEKYLRESGSGFMVGKSLTAADIFVLDIFFGFMKSNLKSKTPDKTKFPLLAAFVQKMCENPKVDNYLKTRKNSPI